MNKTRSVIILLVLAALAAGYHLYTRNGSSSGKESLVEVKPAIGDIRVTFETTGVVEPQNRLEIKPPISGRIEEVLVREGDRVKTGQTVAWMSSTDRAALLDSARAQGEKELAYWKDVYKATPLLSPIDGEVIVRAVEPGQTVSVGDPVIVVSDRLIVKAQFDETDIGRVRKGQKAVVRLDAYPDTIIHGTVDHIAYESQIVNNVTTYDVDIISPNVPGFFRSGMSTTVEIIEKEKQGAMLIPLGAVTSENGKNYVIGKGKVIKEIVTGLSDGNKVEVVSGLSPDDVIFIKQKQYTPPKRSDNGSPFMFSRPKKKNDDKAQ